MANYMVTESWKGQAPGILQLLVDSTDASNQQLTQLQVTLPQNWFETK